MTLRQNSGDWLVTVSLYLLAAHHLYSLTRVEDSTPK